MYVVKIIILNIILGKSNASIIDIKFSYLNTESITQNKKYWRYTRHERFVILKV